MLRLGGLNSIEYLLVLSCSRARLEVHQTGGLVTVEGERRGGGTLRLPQGGSQGGNHRRAPRQARDAPVGARHWGGLEHDTPMPPGGPRILFQPRCGLRPPSAHPHFVADRTLVG